MIEILLSQLLIGVVVLAVIQFVLSLFVEPKRKPTREEIEENPWLFLLEDWDAQDQLEALEAEDGGGEEA